jgi:hypothetical protein
MNFCSVAFEDKKKSLEKHVWENWERLQVTCIECLKYTSILVDYSVEKTLRRQKLKNIKFWNKNHKKLNIADSFINNICNE